VEVHEPEDSEDSTAEAVEEAHKGEDEAADGRRGFLPFAITLDDE
jgi:hypothetical protein